MTRRKILFRDVEHGCCWITPEFNGDKSEFQQAKSQDSCDKDWSEIFDEFRATPMTLEKFKEISNRAQSYYHSHLADRPAILPIEKIEGDVFTENDNILEEIIL
jgi:hypothetical protein